MIFETLFAEVRFGFFDDILIFSSTWAAHLEHVEKILDLLLSHQFYAKFPKYKFGVQTVDYLGHTISNQGVQVDPSKLQVITDWPTSTFIKGLRAFLCLKGFYWCFVRHYTTIASPLTNLLKASTFTCSELAENAFQKLKATMVALPVLSLPDFCIPLEVTTDASYMTLGVVLSQNGHPIAFFSKKMGTRLCASSTYVWKLYVVTEAVKKWRQLLLDNAFKNFTDHKSLKIS